MSAVRGTPEAFICLISLFECYAHLHCPVDSGKVLEPISQNYAPIRDRVAFPQKVSVKPCDSEHTAMSSSSSSRAAFNKGAWYQTIQKNNYDDEHFNCVMPPPTPQTSPTPLRRTQSWSTSQWSTPLRLSRTPTNPNAVTDSQIQSMAIHYMDEGGHTTVDVTSLPEACTRPSSQRIWPGGGSITCRVLRPNPRQRTARRRRRMATSDPSVT